MITMRSGCCALVLVVVFAAAGCAPQTWKSTAGQRGQAPTSLSLYDRPWVWFDDSGARVSFSQMRGTPIVLAVFFTSCHDTCPRTLAKLREVYDQFEREHRRAEFVVVTIDPKTDTPERLRELRKERRLPDAWHLWTGGAVETRQLADLLGIHEMQMDAHLIHDSRIMQFDTDGLSTLEFEIL
jgi:protein SCO1/2